jgi:hypothetical protein
MEDRAHDWMVAAACSQGPRPEPVFATLPRAYRADMLRLALVAAASSAFFVTLAILLRPLPSRSLAAHAMLPDPSASRAAALDARMVFATDVPAPPRLRRQRTAHARYELAAIPAVEDADAPGSLSARPPRRGNVLTRFFRGILGRPAPPLNLKTDPID